MSAIGGGRCSPRIVRLLVDAGADTTSAVRFTSTTDGDKIDFSKTPMDLTTSSLREKKVWGGRCHGRSAERAEGHSPFAAAG